MSCIAELIGKYVLSPLEIGIGKYYDLNFNWPFLAGHGSLVLYSGVEIRFESLETTGIKDVLYPDSILHLKVDGMAIAVIWKPLDVNEDIKLYFPNERVVLLSPIKARDKLVISCKSIILLNDLSAEVEIVIEVASNILMLDSGNFPTVIEWEDVKNEVEIDKKRSREKKIIRSSTCNEFRGFDPFSGESIFFDPRTATLSTKGRITYSPKKKYERALFKICNGKILDTFPLEFRNTLRDNNLL